jgi:ribosomal protein S26
LQLPPEMIAEILSYVSCYKLVALTCKTFNETICENKFFAFYVRTNLDSRFTNILDDNEFFSLIMQSSRRFNSLCIKRSYNNEAFTKIEGLRLELYNLKKFKSSACTAEVLSIFNNLPSGVLQELDIISMRTSTNKMAQLFSNQYNIKKVEADDGFTRLFNWRQTKLKWLKINDGERDLAFILKDQNELEFFSCVVVNQLSINLICHELEPLVELKLHVFDAHGIPELSKLKKLKILTISCHMETDALNRFLSIASNNTVEKLSIDSRYCLKDSTIEHLGSNFPELKELELYTSFSINALNTILHNFPNIEVFDLGLNCKMSGDDVNTYQTGLKHEKLKKLIIRTWRGRICKDLLKFIGCCELEELDLQIALKPNDLEQLISIQTNLKLLSLDASFLHEFSKQDIAALKNNGKKLKEFYCSSCIIDVTIVKLREEFKDQFSVIEFADCNASACWWEMKK